MTITEHWKVIGILILFSMFTFLCIGFVVTTVKFFKRVWVHINQPIKTLEMNNWPPIVVRGIRYDNREIRCKTPDGGEWVYTPKQEEIK